MFRLVMWWAGLAGLYMLFTAEWTAVDWMGAGAAGLVGAGLTALVRRAGLMQHAYRLQWLTAVPAVLKQIPADFALITLTLLRLVAARKREIGAFVARRDFPTGGTGPDGVGWRAWVAMAATWSPNSYVIDIDVESGVRLSHDLVPHRASERPA